MPYLKRLAPSPEPIDCKILTAALDLFVDKGYHSVSIHEVQKLADVSIGSIYRHFGGKEGIAEKLYKHILNEIDELIDGVTEEIGKPVAQLEEIIKQLFEHTEFLPNEPLMCDAEPFIKIRSITSQAIKNGDIKHADTWVATSIIFGGAIRLIQLRLEGLIEKPLTEYREELMSCLWGGLKVEHSSQRKKTLSRAD